MEPKKTIDFWQPLLFAIVLIVGMFLGYKLSNRPENRSTYYGSTTHLDQLIKLIQEKYVDTLDESKLYRSGVDGILKNLDPHTVYIPANELGRVNEELEGAFLGIGIEFYLFHDTVVVSSVIPDGPSDKMNIIPGDKIIRIDDSLIAGQQLSDDEIIRRIRGIKNSKIKLQLLRLDHSQHQLILSRGLVPLKSVSAHFMIDDEVGYIKIDMFSETTYDEFKLALKSLIQDGLKKLVIDVRENPGGYMDAVANVADEIIAGTHNIVSTKGKGIKDSLMTSKDGLFEQGQLCILVDENSASASEILAGAIQDLDRGILIGRRTFGKGLVQEQFELPDNAAIRITTARYYLPSGRCIQRSFADGKEKYRHDIIDRFTNGEFRRKDSIHKKAKQYFTLKRRIVYGDEGVTPDIFVPLDTTYSNQLDTYYIEHMAEQFTHQYYFFHKQEFNIYKSLAIFSNEFNTNSAIKSAMSTYLSAHKLDTNILKISSLQDEIDRTIKAQFAKLLFGNNGKYKVLIPSDKFVIEALKQLKN